MSIQAWTEKLLNTDWQALARNPELLVNTAKAAGILLGAAASYWLVRRVADKIIRKVALATHATWDDVLVRHRLPHTLAHLAPIAVLTWGALAFPAIRPAADRILDLYLIVVLVLFLDRTLSAALDIYHKQPLSRKFPLKGYVQLVKIFVYIVATVVAVAMLVGQSPWALASGIGALTAVLLLIFKDTILSLVASVQIVSNDMLRVGDWIQMDKYGANGDVIDVALHTVKVQNFDKTVVNIPTYKLIDESFINWRGMQDSGGRRIKRALYLDQRSVGFLAAEEVRDLERIAILRPYLERKSKELEEWHRERGLDADVDVINRRRLTNLGTFRAYVRAYLDSHPRIRKDMTFLVRHLAPTPQGLPLEIYVFTDTVVWREYEEIQADIFDHLLAVAGEFGLRVFQGPAGSDISDALEVLAGRGRDTEQPPSGTRSGPVSGPAAESESRETGESSRDRSEN